MQSKPPLAATHWALAAIKTKVFKTRYLLYKACAAALLPLALWATLPAQARSPQSPTAGYSTPADKAASTPLQCPPQPRLDPALYQAEAQKPHPDQGVLWELRKGEQVAYLFATVHVGQLPWIFPGPRTAHALREAPAIALELDPLDPITLQAIAKAMGEDSELQKIILRNNPQLMARMDAMAQSLCIDKAAWDAMATIPKITVLSMGDIAHTGYHAAYGQDINFAAMARALKKPVKALETAQEQIDALGLGSNNISKLATPTELGKALDDIQSGKNRELMTTLAKLWQEGDLQSMEQLVRTCDCLGDIAMQSALLGERNQRMAERIPALIEQYPKMLIAVGSLHMVGDGNLLPLLQKQGYAVRQLTGKGMVTTP
ncbi:MAG: TraB/GumN family protein [Comamonas sp.]